MRSRLSKLGQRAWLTALGLGMLNLLGLETACSGEEFTASGSASGSGGASTGGDSGSEAGEGGSELGGSSGVPGGGSAGTSPSAGSGGKPLTSCDCIAGEYCQDGTNKCRKCADFSRLEFGRPQKLLDHNAQGSQRFARSGGTGSALFYVSGAADSAKIMYTAAPISSAGSPVSSAGQVESAPLWVTGFREEDEAQNLFFDRRQADGRKLVMALWTAAVLTNEALVPEPINVDNSDDYSIAISADTGHVYWMSTRNGEAELLWHPTRVSAPPVPAVLELKIKAGAAECPRAGEDATPWVNAAGTLLLFSNPSLYDDCRANDSGARDLFAAPLDKDGLPLAAATALASLNTTGGTSTETDPSFSPDACNIYFASDSDSDGGRGDFDLYKAQRN
jgi:hypothetical protein